MGSSGFGSFGNYNEEENYGNNSLNVPNHSNGGREVFQGCPQQLSTIKLENVVTSNYYLNTQQLPNNNNEVFLSPTIYNGRLVIIDKNSQLVIGNLPIIYNFLINCLDQNYKGIVTGSGMTPVPFVVVDLYV